jgi:protein O-mannosyl-transferase
MSGGEPLKNKVGDPPVDHPANCGDKRTTAGVCVLLAIAVFLVFGQTLQYDFVNYDDGPYVYENWHVTNGLTLTGIVWAFTHSHAGFWHPMTWVSHMMDCQFYGLNAGGHHLTNVLLHAVTAIILFLVLRQMTGAQWPCAFVAAVFAIHPLRVESVAWVAERKDVLSGLFFMLTLWAYAQYVREVTGKTGTSNAKQNRSRFTCHVSRFYLLSLFFFALGLMSKPMLVTLPFVLLLLDYWPLERFTIDDLRLTIPRLLLEKLPLFLLAIAAGFITFLTQNSYGAVATLEGFPLGSRLANGLVSYLVYILKMLWPAKLAVFYPRSAGFPTGEIAVAGALLLFGTVLAVMFVRRLPCLVVGWLWYLGMLIPVIGIVQSGEQARADRFTYLPQIGLYLLVAWAIRDLFSSRQYCRRMLGLGASIMIAALMVCSWKQTTYWRNSELLWTHALACTSRNHVAHINLGIVFAGRGQTAKAMEHYQNALEIIPDFAEARYDVGNVLADQGRFPEAIEQYQRALVLKPDYAEAHYNLGNLLARQGQADEAIEHFQRAIEIKPDFAEVHYNLGAALARQGRNLEAINHYQQVIEIKPDFAGVEYNLGVVLAAQGFNAEAIPHFQKALENKPDNAGAHNTLAALLAQQGRSVEAIGHLKKAIELQPDCADAYNSLGNVLADQGHLVEAITNYQKALEIKPAFATTHYNLGNALALQGKYAEAIGHFQKALELRPDDAAARRNLNAALALQSQSANRTGKPVNP